MKAEAETASGLLDGLLGEELLLSSDTVGMAVGVLNVWVQALKIKASTIK
jgi:hypothetical protein